MSNADEPAFSVIEFDDLGLSKIAGVGLTKREYFAAMAMQGIISDSTGLAFEEIAHDAVRFADALIAALERKPE
jgi:hypothetical protein